MKLFVRFLLSFTFFLLGGYAHTSQRSISYFPKSTAVQAGHASKQNAPAFYSQAPASGTRHVSDIFTDTEVQDDDDDESKHKKSSGANKDGLNFIYAQPSASIYHYVTSCLPSCEHLSFSSSIKCIIHCVIRI